MLATELIPDVDSRWKWTGDPLEKLPPFIIKNIDCDAIFGTVVQYEYEDGKKTFTELTLKTWLGQKPTKV
jgi:hypothetical protein